MDWAFLLSRQPQFSCHCDLDKLKHSGEDWAKLLTAQPEQRKFMDKAAALDFLVSANGEKYLENAFLSQHPPVGKKKKS